MTHMPAGTVGPRQSSCPAPRLESRSKAVSHAGVPVTGPLAGAHHHPPVGPALDEAREILAEAYAAKGRYAAARSELYTALGIIRDVPGPEPHEQARLTNNIGVYYVLQKGSGPSRAFLCALNRGPARRDLVPYLNRSKREDTPTLNCARCVRCELVGGDGLPASGPRLPRRSSPPVKPCPSTPSPPRASLAR